MVASNINPANISDVDGMDSPRTVTYGASWSRQNDAGLTGKRARISLGDLT
jgi:hypothetical protein